MSDCSSCVSMIKHALVRGISSLQRVGFWMEKLMLAGRYPAKHRYVNVVMSKLVLASAHISSRVDDVARAFDTMEASEHGYET